MLSLEFLTAPTLAKPGPLVAVYGDDDYLRREALLRLRGGLRPETFTGSQAEWRDVHDALTMVSLFGDDADLVVVEDADAFVSGFRDKLEAWAAQTDARRTLVLEVRTWPKTTRLAKAVEKSGLAIDCGIPSDNRGGGLAKFTKAAKAWLTQRATSIHQATLEPAAASRLFELLPLSLGLMDQEVAKLSLLADDGRIDAKLVDAHVGDWRTRQTWDMIDAMAEGRAADAMYQLDKLIAAGEAPIAILAQVAYTLRKFATASRLIEQAEAAGKRLYFPQIMQQSGFWKNKIDDATRQLKAIGRARAVMLATWLLEMDLAMKGHNSTEEAARLELERLIARLSSAARVDPRVPAPVR